MSGALVLDSEGLAKAVQRDRDLHEWLTAARDADLPVITSAAVLVEVIHPRINDAALKWTLSRLRVEPVTQPLAQSAATLLRAAGLHGHKYAIDAMLCATALAQPGHVTILTSDVEDIAMLTTDHPRVTAEKV
ncbi:PIN domain-containing protein [Streptomyces peucetius]|nr:DNA-binding protein [Streptomyces peucetius subsp. caesius ATCC 27952]